MVLPWNTFSHQKCELKLQLHFEFKKSAHDVTMPFFNYYLVSFHLMEIGDALIIINHSYIILGKCEVNWSCAREITSNCRQKNWKIISIDENIKIRYYNFIVIYGPSNSGWVLNSKRSNTFTLDAFFAHWPLTENINWLKSNF